MKHHASADFRACFRALPGNVQRLAAKNFALLRQNPSHPALDFKSIVPYVPVRVGLSHRALGVVITDGVLWFWIGSHADYDKAVGASKILRRD